MAQCSIWFSSKWKALFAHYYWVVSSSVQIVLFILNWIKSNIRPKRENTPKTQNKPIGHR